MRKNRADRRRSAQITSSLHYEKTRGRALRVFLRGFILYEQVGAGFYFLSVSNYKQGKECLTRELNKRNVEEEGDL